MKTTLRVQNLILFVCFVFLSLGAHANPSKIVYELEDEQRVEVHFDKNEAYGSVKILLFRKNQTNPVVLTLEDPKDQAGNSLVVGQKRKFVFPTPAHAVDTTGFPEWIVVDSYREASKPLEHGGILIIRDQSESGNFVQAFPVLPQAVQDLGESPRPYVFKDEPRTKRFPYRRYSAAFVASAGHSDAPEANILLSILDMNLEGEDNKLGTVILRRDGLFQSQDRVWNDFRIVGRHYEFQPSDQPGFMNILVDGKVWGQPVAHGNVKWQTIWPHAQDRSDDPTLSPELREKIAANRRQAKISEYEIAKALNDPKLAQQSYQQFIKGIEDGVPAFRQEEEEKLERHYAIFEPLLKHEMDFTQELLQRSGIAEELASERKRILGHQVKDFPSNSSTVQFVVLSVRTENKRAERKTTNWLISVDSKTQQILGKHKIPKDHSVRDLTVLPSGQVYLKNGRVLYLTPSSRVKSCADIFKN